MLKILIVEDDVQLATTLKYLVEDNPRYRVVATANDLDSAVDAAQEFHPDLALVDLRLANATTGFSVAVRMISTAAWPPPKTLCAGARRFVRRCRSTSRFTTGSRKQASRRSRASSHHGAP